MENLSRYGARSLFDGLFLDVAPGKFIKPLAID